MKTFFDDQDFNLAFDGDIKLTMYLRYGENEEAKMTSSQARALAAALIKAAEEKEYWQ